MTKKSWANCTYGELCRMGRDNNSFADYSIMVDPHTVFISEQPIGESPIQKIEIPRRAFNFLVREYLKERELKSK